MRVVGDRPVDTADIILDSLPHPALLLDQERRIVACNVAARDMGAVVGEYCWASFGRSKFVDVAEPPETRTCWFCRSRECQVSLTAQRNEVELDGTHWEVHWVPSSGGFYLHYCIDITERVERERQRDADQEKLFVSQRLESLGRFAAGIAHDFNNMLMVVSGNVSLLGTYLPVNSPLCDELDEIQTAVSRASDLTKQLMTFAGKSSSKVEIFVLADLVRASMKMLRRLIRGDVDIETATGDGSECLVAAPPGAIQQVIVNLVSNARDAGAKNITVVLRRLGKHVLMAVEDDGGGVSQEVAERLFEPFFTTKSTGAGLGLSVSQAIIFRAGGNLSYEERQSGGSRFIVSLPIDNSSATWEPDPNSSSILAPATPAGCETILVVEDSERVRRAVVGMLVRSGYKVLQAANGEAALRLLHDDDLTVDLVVSDVVMPIMCGDEMARTMIRMNPNTKILLMSGYDANGAAHKFVGNKNVAFIQKPFGDRVMACAVRALLDKE